MLWRTHFIGGAIAGTLAVGAPELSIAAATIGGVAALLPDIDTPYSKVGNAIPIFPRLLNFFLGHRGVLHSPIGVTMFFLPLLSLLQLQPLVIAAMAGVMSHIMLDCLSDSGCPILFPIKRKHYGIPLVRTGSIIEKFLLYPGLLFFLGLVYINLFKSLIYRVL